MSGHSHWAGIKHKKGAADQKRGKVFSKLLAAVTAAAKTEPNTEFNPRLRTAVQKAKEANVPNDNIDRAIKRASEAGGELEELTLEAYGPAGAAIMIEAITDNKNRTVAEVKKIILETGAKWAEPGSVRWAFEKTADQRGLDADSHGNWKAKFSPELGADELATLANIIEAIKEQEDVQAVYTTAKLYN